MVIIMVWVVGVGGVAPRCLWEVLVRCQHLSDGHIHPAALRIPVAHGPVILGHRLQQSAVLLVYITAWGFTTGLHLYGRMTRAPLGWCDNAWHSVVEEAARSWHHHYVTAVHVHGSGWVLSTGATQEEDGWLPKTVGKENITAFIWLCFVTALGRLLCKLC